MTRPSHRLLVSGLLALSLLYAWWFFDDDYRLASMLVFVLPPIVLAAMVWRGVRTAAFFSGVLALTWFTHGVLVAWVRPEDRLPALLEIGLAVLVVLAASVPGLRARYARKPKP